MHRATIMFIIFRDFLMIKQIFLSQVEQSMITSNKLAYEIRKYRENLKT